jgi:molecular chaperone DnaJ
MNISFEEAIYGCKKDINLEVEDSCPECNGVGGFNPTTCSECRGSGTVTSEQRTLFGSFLTKTTCPKCKGTGTRFEKTCFKCHGDGTIRTNKTITIKVPAGIDTENRLRVPGKGEAGINGGNSGDLYVEFTVKEHSMYKRVDDDIYLNVPLTIAEAVLGCKKEIPTIYGKVSLSIPAGTNSGDKLRLRGKGIENVQSHRKGDMYVVAKVIIPTKLSKEQKKLFESLSQTDLESSSEFKKFVKFTSEQ